MLRPERAERFAFAVVTAVTVVALLVEVTLFDVRFGGGVVHDRYLFYVVPSLLVAFACALREPVRRRVVLAAGALVAAGFLVAGLPTYGKLDVDTPVSDVDLYLRTSLHSLTAARLALALGTVLLAVLYVQAASLLSRRVVCVAAALLACSVLPAQTWYAYATLFRQAGTSGRPLTVSQGDVLGWVDRYVGSAPSVTMLPYPYIAGEFQPSLAYWWDLEFWNESVAYAAYEAGAFEGTPSTFPKIDLRFDVRTGRANVSPSRYAAELVNDARFHLYGTIVVFDRNIDLIDTGNAWRADWISLGLYDDGWTIPGRTAVVRIFPLPNQAAGESRVLKIKLESPARRRVEVVSNAGSWSGTVSPGAGTVAAVTVCEPAHGYTDVTISARGQSPIYGDMRDINSFGSYRTAGVLLSTVNLAELNGPCRPPA